MKTYVIDTNTVMDYPESIFEFGNNKVVIPFTLINELDGLKKDSGKRGEKARRINKILSELCANSVLQKSDLKTGIKLNNGGILIAEKTHTELLPKDYPAHFSDNKILSIALYFKKKGEDVFLILKDNNFTARASTLGIKAFSYDFYKNHLYDDYKNNSSQNSTTNDNKEYYYKRDLELEKCLIESGAEVDAKDKSGDTRLIKACKNGNLLLVKYLVEHGADVNATTFVGRSCLMIAVQEGNIELVKYLVEHGADINAETYHYGEKIIVKACEEENIELVKYLVEHGADVNAKNRFGKKILDIAYKRKNVEIVKCLTNEINKRKIETKKRQEEVILKTKKVINKVCSITLDDVINTIKKYSK